MSTPGVFSTPYHEYTRGFRYEQAKVATEFREFSFSHFLSPVFEVGIVLFSNLNRV